MRLIWHHGPQGETMGHGLLLHGFGAHELDLVGISDELDPDHRLTWHFPRAPIAISTGAFAWFPRSPEDLQRVLRGKFFDTLPSYFEQGMDEIVDWLFSDLEALDIRDHLEMVGGFSQGSMMAFLLALKFDLLISKVVLFSSNLFSEAVLKERLTKLLGATQNRQASSAIFMSHGLYDAVLSYQGAIALCELLQKFGLNPTFENFPGGHEIPRAIVAKARLQ